MNYTCGGCGSLRKATPLSVVNRTCEVCDKTICGSCESVRCGRCHEHCHLKCSTKLRDERLCNECFMKAAREALKNEPPETQYLATLAALRSGVWNPKRKVG